MDAAYFFANEASDLPWEDMVGQDQKVLFSKVAEYSDVIASKIARWHLEFDYEASCFTREGLWPRYASNEEVFVSRVCEDPRTDLVLDVAKSDGAWEEMSDELCTATIRVAGTARQILEDAYEPLREGEAREQQRRLADREAKRLAEIARYNAKEAERQAHIKESLEKLGLS